jgi:hypothetical protein
MPHATMKQRYGSMTYRDTMGTASRSVLSTEQYRSL